MNDALYSLITDLACNIYSMKCKHCKKCEKCVDDNLEWCEIWKE